MGLVPNHRSKVNIAIKWVEWIFVFPGIYKLFLHSTVFYLVCNSIMSKNMCKKTKQNKKYVHTLVKNTLLLKHANHHLLNTGLHKPSISKVQ